MFCKEVEPGVFKPLKARIGKKCWRCKIRYPKGMFKSLPDGWYSRDGKSYSCRLCTLKDPTRYKKVKGKMFDSKEPYKVNLVYRLRELFK